MRVGAARLEDRLGPNEPPYRSRGEAQVGRVLDLYGIPFEHEKPTPVYDDGLWGTWYPDFTLPSYGGLIVEYAGMPDRPDYMAGARHKQNTYARNGRGAVFVYPDEIGPRDWPDRLVRRIDAAYSGRQSTMGMGGGSFRPYTSPRY